MALAPFPGLASTLAVAIALARPVMLVGRRTEAAQSAGRRREELLHREHCRDGRLLIDDDLRIGRQNRRAVAERDHLRCLGVRCTRGRLSAIGDDVEVLAGGRGSHAWAGIGGGPGGGMEGKRASRVCGGGRQGGRHAAVTGVAGGVQSYDRVVDRLLPRRRACRRSRRRSRSAGFRSLSAARRIQRGAEPRRRRSRRRCALRRQARTS